MRLDSALFTLGLFQSRQKAKEAISERKVHYQDKILSKPSLEVFLQYDTLVLDNTPIHKDDLVIQPQFVSRAGSKLDCFLQERGLHLQGIRALDIGSSTGGFTQVLLQRGVSHIVCVDVGDKQLHKTLRKDSRICLFENCDIRDFAKTCKESFGLIVCDVSFISLFVILPSLLSLDSPTLLLLFKPQFEAGRQAKRNKKGVLQDHKLIQDKLSLFVHCLEKTHLVSIHKSQILGKEGNVEFFILAHRK
ncbi:MAG: TlyA family RNA methyltransferase [Helicobacter sp.]|nr:TlyA family RNA methyltransferase [Helicobacter sp.]MDD7567991.1 TlyA family RNA methyltransferase [Helicobacter sp.]MDY5740322.1 TlyA family RNA methyltransferase [Helicobacter sp.]